MSSIIAATSDIYAGISEMWEAFLPSIVLFFFAIWLPEQEKKK